MPRQPSNPQSPEETPSFVKQQTLKVLRSLISLLQAIVKTLETPSAPSSATSQLPLWSNLLTRVRGWLPLSLSQRLNDFDLGVGIVAGMAVALLVTASLIPSRSSDIAQVPSSEPSVSTELPTEPTLSPLVEPEPAEIALQPEPEEGIEEDLLESEDSLELPEEESSDLPSIAEELPEEGIAEPEESEEIEPTEIPENPAPEEAEEPENSQPIPVEIAPPPPPVLTPEQRLIVTIQNQISNLTQEYEEGLIDSIQADFLNSVLTIKVDRQWYELVLDRQKDLANDMFKRARQLDFTRLEVTDIDGQLLARNAVVGTNMVIIKPEEFERT